MSLTKLQEVLTLCNAALSCSSSSSSFECCFGSPREQELWMDEWVLQPEDQLPLLLAASLLVLPKDLRQCKTSSSYSLGLVFHIVKSVFLWCDV